jgi:hypothetical protein
MPPEDKKSGPLQESNGHLQVKSLRLKRHSVGKTNGAPEEIRTPDPQIRSLVLYPAELRVRANRLSVGVGDPLKRDDPECKRPF